MLAFGLCQPQISVHKLDWAAPATTWKGETGRVQAASTAHLALAKLCTCFQATLYFPFPSKSFVGLLCPVSAPFNKFSAPSCYFWLRSKAKLGWGSPSGFVPEPYPSRPAPGQSHAVPDLQGSCAFHSSTNAVWAHTRMRNEHRGSSLVVVCRLLVAAASLVAEHRL